MQRRDTKERHVARKARLEGCIYKPRNAKDSDLLSKKGFFPGVLRGSRTLPTP